jgi:hypothetical protein
MDEEGESSSYHDPNIRKDIAFTNFFDDVNAIGNTMVLEELPSYDVNDFTN